MMYRIDKFTCCYFLRVASQEALLFGYDLSCKVLGKISFVYDTG